MVHTDNEILLSHGKDKFGSVIVWWMNLDPPILDDVSQKEKIIINAYVGNLENWL